MKLFGNTIPSAVKARRLTHKICLESVKRCITWAAECAKTYADIEASLVPDSVKKALVRLGYTVIPTGDGTQVTVTW
jgi:hypothetical protein